MKKKNKEGERKVKRRRNNENQESELEKIKTVRDHSNRDHSNTHSIYSSFLLVTENPTITTYF